MPANFSIIIERNLENSLIRRWIWLLFEAIVIAIIFAIIVWNPTSYRISEKIDMQSSEWQITGKLKIEDRSMIDPQINYLSYISGNAFLMDLVTNVAVRLNLQAKPTPNEIEMEADFDSISELCGIVFDKEDELPTHLSVRLRFPNALRSVDDKVIFQNNFWQYRINGVVRDDETKNKNLFAGIFMREGFLQVQHALFQEWLSKIKSDANPPNIAVGWFRFPKDHRKRISLQDFRLNTLLYSFAFCFSFCNTVYVYARSCQKNTLPHLWRYGYRYSKNWWGKIIVSTIKLIIFDLIITCILYINKSNVPEVITFQHVKFAYFVLFLVIYNLQYIVCAIFYALLMANGKRSVLLALTIWVATYACFASLLRGNYKMNSVVMFLLIIHFNNVFPFGMSFLYNSYENSDNEYWTLIGCMLSNVFLYILLSSLMQYLKPGRYVHVYKFDFLYLRSIFSKRSQFDRMDEVPKELKEKTSWINYEYGPLGVEGFVKLRNICTTYKLFPDRHHLKNISLTLFKGEITVLCGHHSSGKTSLICIMAGWQIPKIGSITYGEFDLHKDWNKARRLCDVSMPNSFLFDGLTVRTTLVHFIKIKQEIDDPSYLRAEVRKWLDVLKPALPNKDQKVSDLTYDKKRLLCLCIVLSCDTKIILLDDPTQNMRLKEKQFYWKILRTERTNRVILLATSSLDCANYIGDRVALLDNGKLLAYGTHFFLKTTFSDIYYLIINKNIEAPIIPISRFILSYIPDISLEHAISSRIVYKVPSDKRPLFQRMLLNLEKSSLSLGIHRIQMLTSSLNEVAMLLTKDKVKPFNRPAEALFANRNITAEKSLKKQINAMIFKKMVNQMAHLWPASMIMLSIVITLIIGKLSEILPTPPARHNATQFGLRSTAKEPIDLPSWNIDNCNFIRVMNLETDEHVNIIKSNTYFFHKDAYKCHKEVNFENYLTDSMPLPKNHLAAIEFNSATQWTIWLNKRELDSGPAALNLAHNLILKSIFGNNNQNMIKISNDPFLMKLHNKMRFLKEINCHLRLPTIAGIVIPFIVLCFILALVEERHSHMWVIQRIAGLQLSVYWVVTFIWDWLTYIFFAFLFIIVQFLVHIEGVGYQEKFWIFGVISIYGFSALGWIYTISMFMQKSKTNGFLIYFMYCHITGIILFSLVHDMLRYLIHYTWIYIFLPNALLVISISNIYLYAKTKFYCESMCDTYGCKKTEDGMCEFNNSCCLLKSQKEFSKIELTYFLLNAGISWTALFIVSSIRAQRNSLTENDESKYRTACFSYDDSEVKELRQMVSNTIGSDINHKTLLVDQIEYALPKNPGIIHTTSFATEKGECIAIYGNQRSGTSRLARTLAGINPLKFGTIYVEGVHMNSELLRAWNYIGYCPPNRGLYNNFTARELMRFLNMIAGTPKNIADEMVRATFQLLNMRSYVHKICGHLSVEKQRTVNLAASIVISKTVLILDQPTTGMPISTCQEVWNALQYLLEIGRTIILTTSAGVECRILAHKMLIYERGEMFAYGGFFTLLDRYTTGIYLQIKLNRDGDSLKQMQTNFQRDIENLYRYVSFINTESELCSRVDNCLSFYLPISDVKYSYLFGSLEKNKSRLNISDYTINRGTIEEIMYTILTRRRHTFNLN